MAPIPTVSVLNNPASSTNLPSPPSNPSPAKSGSVTMRMRVDSIGTNTRLATAPAIIDATKNGSIPGLFPDAYNPNSLNANTTSGFVISYTPNLSAPSMPYPTRVGPRPATRADAPSSLSIDAAAGNTERYLSGFDCMRVLTTSMGVVMPWDIAAHVPPATKYR